MPVLPEVASTTVVRPGSISPAASAASIIETPILSFTLPAGLCDSSLPISSAWQSGATRVKRTMGVSPTSSARFSGIALASLFSTRMRISPGLLKIAAREAVGGGEGRRALGEERGHGLLDRVDATARLGRVVAARSELDGDVDQAARVHDVVGRVEDPVLVEVLGQPVVGELVVGGAADDVLPEPSHVHLVYRTAERAGLDHVDVGEQRRARVGPACSQLLGELAL